MVLYLSIIAITWIVLSVINILVVGIVPSYAFISILMCVAFEFAIDGILAALLHKLPNKWFDPNKKIFSVSKTERKFLDFIKVKKWKDSVWELGGLGGFSKSEIKEQDNPDYIKLFLIESNKGVLIHVAGILAGFLLIFVMPIKYVWSISIPIALVNTLLSFMSTAVLRYNIPKLKVAYERAVRIRARAFKEKVNDNKDEENKKIV